jgi:hypothetical protein
MWAYVMTAGIALFGSIVTGIMTLLESKRTVADNIDVALHVALVVLFCVLVLVLVASKGRALVAGGGGGQMAVLVLLSGSVAIYRLIEESKEAPRGFAGVPLALKLQAGIMASVPVVYLVTLLIIKQSG